MIVELALGVAAVLVVSTLARVASERVSGATPEPSAPEPVASGTEALELGDVLLHAGESLWLCGALDLDEEGRVMRLFRTPDNARAEWVGQLDEDGRDLILMRVSTELPEGRIPDRLFVAGRPLSLERRGRAIVTGRGEQLPALPSRVDYVVLGEPGGRVAWVLEGEGVRLALVGDRTARERVERLPGSAATHS